MIDAPLEWSGLTAAVEELPQVMVVEEDARLRGATARLLGAAGYHFRMAASVQEAHSWMSAMDFDVVVLDIGLPAVNGTQPLEWLLIRHPEAAVIMVTALEDREVAVQCRENGARSCLVKPVQADELKFAIDDAVAVGHSLPSGMHWWHRGQQGGGRIE